MSAFPPPWSLFGRGHILVCRFSDEQIDRTGVLPLRLHGRFDGGLGCIMVVDYADSPVGPYQELLVVPGYFATPHGRSRAISKIWVTSALSQTWGRANWGIPKERATCSWETEGPTDHVTFRCNDRPLAHFEISSNPRRTFPITSALIPRRVRALEQPWHDEWIRTVPKAHGRVGRAKLETCTVDTDRLPEFDPGCVLSAWHVPRFALTFGHPMRRN